MGGDAGMAPLKPVSSAATGKSAAPAQAKPSKADMTVFAGGTGRFPTKTVETSKAPLAGDKVLQDARISKLVRGLADLSAIASFGTGAKPTEDASIDQQGS